MKCLPLREVAFVAVEAQRPLLSWASGLLQIIEIGAQMLGLTLALISCQLYLLHITLQEHRPDRAVEFPGEVSAIPNARQETWAKRNGKMLGLSSRSLMGAASFSRVWRDASTIQAISLGSSTEY